MSEITLSAGVRQNLLSLQSTAKLMADTQTRLATGKKVNSALDDPSAFFTAASLNNRASDLNRLLDSEGQAIQTLKAADEGIKALTNLVENLQSVAKQARDTEVVSTTLTGTVTGLDGTLALDGGDPDLGAATGDTLTISIDGGAASTAFTVGADPTAEDIDDVIAGIEAVDSDLSVTFDDDGALLITDARGRDVTVGGNLGDALGVSGSSTNGSNRDKFEGDYNDLLTQISQLAADSGYKGVNLLREDDLEVTFNEDGTSSLSIEGVDFDADGLGLGTISSGDFGTEANIDSALASIKSALTSLREQASTFGSNLSVVENRMSHTEGMINTLETGAANLTLADTNEEGANLLALQTRQQLSTTALSMAAQADQNVLRLF